MEYQKTDDTFESTILQLQRMKSTESCFGISLSTCTDRAIFRNLQKKNSWGKKKKKIPGGMVIENFYSVTVSLMRPKGNTGLSMFPA